MEKSKRNMVRVHGGRTQLISTSWSEGRIVPATMLAAHRGAQRAGTSDDCRDDDSPRSLRPSLSAVYLVACGVELSRQISRVEVERRMLLCTRRVQSRYMRVATSIVGLCGF
jgi:hypothetical protein